MRVNVKFPCQNGLSQIFHHSLLSVLPLAEVLKKKKRTILPHHLVICCLDGFWPEGLCFAVSFWGENTSFLFGQQNNLFKTWLIDSIIDFAWWYKNENQRQMCETLFFALQSLAGVFKWAIASYWAIMFTMMIFDSPNPENIRLRESPSGQKVLLEDGGVKSCSSKISRHQFLLYEGCRASIFAQRWA